MNKKFYNILNSMDNIHANDDLILRQAAKCGNFAAVKYLVKHGANIHAAFDDALCLAVSKGHLKIVLYLVEHGADIHTRADSALVYAAERGDIPMMEYLQKHGLMCIDSALECAAAVGQLRAVQYLIKHGADIHADYDAAFSAAYENGYFHIVKYLNNQHQLQKHKIS